MQSKSSVIRPIKQKVPFFIKQVCHLLQLTLVKTLHQKNALRLEEEECGPDLASIVEEK